MKISNYRILKKPRQQDKNAEKEFFNWQAKNRDALRKALEENGIQTKIHYQTPLPFQPCMKPFVNDLGVFPIAKKVSGEALSLPMYPTLLDSEVKEVIDAIIKFYNEKK